MRLHPVLEKNNNLCFGDSGSARKPSRTERQNQKRGKKRKFKERRKKKHTYTLSESPFWMGVFTSTHHASSSPKKLPPISPTSIYSALHPASGTWETPVDAKFSYPLSEYFPFALHTYLMYVLLCNAVPFGSCIFEIQECLEFVNLYRVSST